MSAHDDETQTIQECWARLSRLSPSAAWRVVEYLDDRLTEIRINAKTAAAMPREPAAKAPEPAPKKLRRIVNDVKASPKTSFTIGKLPAGITWFTLAQVRALGGPVRGTLFRWGQEGRIRLSKRLVGAPPGVMLTGMDLSEVKRMAAYGKTPEIHADFVGGKWPVIQTQDLCVLRKPAPLGTPTSAPAAAP